MPKTATPRKAKPKTLADILGYGENEKQFIADLVSGASDISGRGVIAPLLGLAGDIGGMAENGIRSLIGKPQVEPYGGSEHIGRLMQGKGLVTATRRPKTELLASLISPSAAAKTVINAPKTAMTALRWMDNLDSAPTMANYGQRGAIDVWHGSPHKFEQFKAMDNIGGGEGAQAYGHGGYHASNPNVSLEYMTAGKNMGFLNWDTAPQLASKAFALGKGNKEAALKILDDEISATKGVGKKSNLEFAKKVIERDGVEGANLYRNQLRWPDPAREAADPLSDKHFLDWDNPLSEQDASVQQSIANAMRQNGYGDKKIAEVMSLEGQRALNYVHNSGDKDKYSQVLNQHGIPGIRYLDGGSRSAGQGSHNYVTFDDNLVNILERNGQPVTAPQPGLLGKMVAPQDEALRVAQANAAKPVSEGGLGLRPDNTPEERAAAMGFDTDAYHGTPYSFDSFSLSPRGSDTLGIHVGTQEQANDILKNTGIAKRKLGEWKPDANIMPLMIRSGKNVEFPDLGKHNSWDIGGLNYQLYENDIPFTGDKFNPTYADFRDSIQSAGYDGVKYVNDFEGTGSGAKQESLMVFDPRNIRSRFAAFDPMKRDSTDIMAGLSPLLFARPKEEKKK